MYAVYPKASEEHWSGFSPVWSPMAHKGFRVWQQAALVLRQDAFLGQNRWVAGQESGGIQKVSSFIFSVMRGDNRDTMKNALFGSQ